MPIRFPTEAANDPGMKPAAPESQPGDPRADTRSDAKDGAGEAKPGKDINQAGFLREHERDGES